METAIVVAVVLTAQLIQLWILEKRTTKEGRVCETCRTRFAEEAERWMDPH